MPSASYCAAVCMHLLFRSSCMLAGHIKAPPKRVGSAVRLVTAYKAVWLDLEWLELGCAETHSEGLKVGADGEVLVVIHILRVCDKRLERNLEVGIRLHNPVQLLDGAVAIPAWKTFSVLVACMRGMSLECCRCA